MHASRSRNAIAGHADLLDADVFGPLGAAQREAIHRIHAAERHLLGLINDILNFAKLRSERVRFSMHAVRVATVLETVAPLVELLMRLRGIAFEMDRQEHRRASPTLVCADPEKLQQILINLVSNAMKFTARGGRIRIAVDEGAPGSETMCVNGLSISRDLAGENGRIDGRQQSGRSRLDVHPHAAAGSRFSHPLTAAWRDRAPRDARARAFGRASPAIAPAAADAQQGRARSSRLLRVSRHQARR